MNEYPICAVTGAGGYVGSRLVSHLRTTGFTVYELHHSIPEYRSKDEFVQKYVLSELIEPAMLRGIDVLLHCAYDLQLIHWDEIEAINVKGTLRLFEAASQAGVKRIIFISSLSAFEGCKSLYGQAKLAVEKELLRQNQIVVRPGLVYDENPGGVVGTIIRLMPRFRILPVIAGDKILYLCHSADLAALVEELCTADIKTPRLIMAASPEPLAFHKIIKVLAKQHKLGVMLVPLPTLPVIVGLRLLEWLGWRGPFRSDSLVSLLNQNQAIIFHDLQPLKTHFRLFDPSVSSLNM